ncbi:MAG: putative sporulation protein YtxC [Bacillota bacterium]|jgi:putative sporulation protein YtxC|nr:hypothetical protein [Bacillota bacterium]
MDCVRLGSRVAGEALRRRVIEKAEALRTGGVNISLRFRSTGPIYMVTCCARPSRAGHNAGRESGRDAERDVTDGIAMRRSLADAAAGTILNEVEQAMAIESLNQRGPSLTADEKADVCQRALRLLAEAAEKPTHEELAQRIYDYLLEADTLILEGFLQFRLRDYMISISLCARESLLSHLADREHREFVKLLRMFVESQESREDVVHVLRGIDGAYELVSDDGSRIQGQLVDAVVADLVDEGVDPADLLVSALISVAPARIVVHFISDQDTLDTLESVFQGRVEKCHGAGCSIAGCERALVSTSVVTAITTQEGEPLEPIH